MSGSDYLNINKDLWNGKVDIHLNSDFYDQKAFISGKSSLNEIELKLLGDLEGKTVLHLQCHFGQDTISLARLGATSTGVDFSEKAVDRATEIAAELNVDSSFICSDIYALPEKLEQQFDIVFTSYGTIGWLPDIEKWANVVSRFLKPGGKFVFAEFHPVVWSFDDDFTFIKYRYFKTQPIIEIEEGTYAEKGSDYSGEAVCWNHSLSSVVNALIDQGLKIEKLDEYDYSPYNCFNDMEEFEKGKYRIKKMGDKLPMVYAILATKNA